MARRVERGRRIEGMGVSGVRRSNEPRMRHFAEASAGP